MITNVDQGKLVKTNYRERKIFKAHPSLLLKQSMMVMRMSMVIMRIAMMITIIN